MDRHRLWATPQVTIKSYSSARMARVFSQEKSLRKLFRWDRSYRVMQLVGDVLRDHAQVFPGVVLTQRGGRPRRQQRRLRRRTGHQVQDKPEFNIHCFLTTYTGCPVLKRLIHFDS